MTVIDFGFLRGRGEGGAGVWAVMWGATLTPSLAGNQGKELRLARRG